MGTIDDISSEYLRQRSPLDSGQEEWSDVKFFWVPDDHHGFIPVQQVLEADDQNNGQLKAVRKPDNQVERVRRDSLLPANSTRYDKHEDMAELGELNEATILHCLKTRYQSGLIYTYSGLFLVAVNPYKPLPIYSADMVEWFKGQARRGRPPHIYAVADAALADLLRSQQNQSILITGESGAGKTENTKKVIQYLTSVTGLTSATGGGQSGELEQKILSTNPILEAFGNAQTGKFVRIEFDGKGKIVGADIERYLLEKSRVTHRSSLERSFHVFYQLLSAPRDILDKYALRGGVAEYHLLNTCNHNVDSIDDSADFQLLLQSFATMGISEQEQDGIFKTLAAILHLGNIRLASSSSGDQAVITDRTSMSSLCALLCVDEDEFERALLNPILRVGRETIKQSRDVPQVTYSIEALCRTLYERLFSWLVERLNRGLRASQPTSDQRNLFIGVLDIAGFEIFDKNSFEQLCINYTNEKLQQFYNHHMFVQEQEEYKREHVEWSFTDFGLDLQPTIDMLERNNPVGVFACLDEDCIVPKANDRSFTDKLIQLCKNKTDRLEPLRFGNGFAVQHYAGRVEYDTDGWLDKNKDPVNDSLFKILATSNDKLIAELSSVSDDAKSAVVKKGLFRTVAQRHRESLALLMHQLHSTKPHFVRCIVPNKEKKAGSLDAKLVLDQLKCNGVFEGIRVCRNGYPGRVAVEQFAKIYRVLISDSSVRVYDPKELCRLVLDKMGFQDGTDFKIGISKVFLKNGRTTVLDDHRDAVLTRNAIVIQTLSKLKIAKHLLRRRNSQNDAVKTIGDCLPKLMRLKRSPFWQLFQHVRPLLNVARAENRISELEKELEGTKEAHLTEQTSFEREKAHLAQEIEEVREHNDHLLQRLSALQIDLNMSSDEKSRLVEQVSGLEVELVLTKQKVLEELEPTIQELRDKIASVGEINAALIGNTEELTKENGSLKSKLSEADNAHAKLIKQQDNLNMKLTELDVQVNELKGLLSLEQEKNVALSISAADACAQLCERTEEMAQYKLVNEAEKLNLQQCIDRHVIEVSNKENAIALLQQSLEQHKTAIESMETQLCDAQSQIQEITTVNQRLAAEKDKLADTIKSLEMTVEELNGKLAVSSEELLSVRQVNDNMKADLDGLRGAIEDNRAVLDGKESTIADNLQKLANLEQNLCEKNQLLSEQSGKLEEYQQKTLSLQEDLLLANERLQLSESQKTLLEAQLKDDQLAINKLMNEHKGTEKRLKELELSMIEMKLNERPSFHVAETMERLGKEGEARIAAIKDNVKLERRIVELESLLVKSDSNSKSLLEQLAIKERENNDLKKANDLIEAEVAKERHRIDQLTGQLNSIKKSLL